MGNKWYTVGIILIIILFASCIRRDIPEVETSKQNTKILNEKIIYPKDPITKTIDNVDYRQLQSPVGKFGGELIISTIGEGPKTFNPFNSKDSTSSTMSEIMYDGLITLDPITGKVLPKMAKNIIVDRNLYTVELRKGLKWSDGVEITADDVIFTWKNIILAGLGNTSLRDSIIVNGKLPRVEKLGKYTVRFVLPQSFAPFLTTLSTPIAPKHIFQPVVAKGAKAFDSFLSTTTPPKDFVTSGAFRLKEYVPAQRVVFERNPKYYEINLKDEKLPYLNKIVYMIVGDLNNELLKFEAKEIDIISLRGSTVARYKEKEQKSDYKIYNLGPDTGTMFIAINLNNRKNKNNESYVNPIKQKWFRDLNFRTAIDYAIDRKSMVQNIANGLAKPLFTAESLNSIYLNKNIKGHEQNIEKAKFHLGKSGFKVKSGKLFDKDNNQVEFDLYTNAGQTEREAIGVMIKQDLEDLGMKVNFKPIEFNSLVNKLVNSFDWDMVIMGLTGSPLEPNNGKNVWHSLGSLHLFNQRLPQDRYSDKFEWEERLDEIFDKGALKNDFNARKKLYDEYQSIVYNQRPIIYLYSPIRITAIRKKFKNIYPTPLAGIIYNLDEIYVEDSK